MKLSVLFGKRIESATERSGYVLRVNANGNKITGLTCVDGDENEFDVPVKNIKNSGGALVYSSGDGCVGGRSVVLGVPVFDGEGNYIGKLTDIACEKFTITAIHVGNKKFSAEDVICGDAVIVKNYVRFLKSDVKKDGKVIFRRGTPLTEEVAAKARLVGEYVQTNLKTIN